MPLTESSSEKESSINNVVQRLDRLEELVRAVTGDLHDVKAQQTALGVSLIHLKQQVPGSANGVSAQHTPDSLGTGTSFPGRAPAGHWSAPMGGWRRRSRRGRGEHLAQNQISQIRWSGQSPAMAQPV
jgi:hypothetical protein